jgi:hypothetical protein
MKKKGLGRRILVLLPVGFFSLLVLIFLVNWLSMLLIQPRTPSPNRSDLSWEEDLGAIPPTPEDPESTTISQPLGTFILPEVLSVEDAVEVNGGWILLDRRLGKLHFLDNTSGLLESVGGEGPGLGELRSPVALAAGGSFLWVLNQQGQSLDRFSLQGEFQDRRGVHGGGCLVGLAEELHYIPQKGLILLRICPATLPGPGTAFLEKLDPAGTLTVEVALPLGESGSRRLHLLRHPTASATAEHLFLGTWDTPCIAVLPLTGGATRGVSGHRCLPDFVRAKAPETDRSKMEIRFQRLSEWGFLPMVVPDRYPWFDRIFSTSRGLIVRRILEEEERDLVLLGPHEGSRVSDMVFPEDTFVGEETILAARDLLQGTEIQIFPNPWR